MKSRAKAGFGWMVLVGGLSLLSMFGAYGWLFRDDGTHPVGDVTSVKFHTASGPFGNVLIKQGTMNGRDSFEIDVPKPCQLTTQGLQTDYEIYRVTCGATNYAGVYVGNFGDGIPRSRLLQTRYAWPTEVRVWSEIVPGDQARADQIAASVRLKKPN